MGLFSILETLTENSFLSHTPGEEISYDYGYDINNFKEHICRCGSKNCIGYIVGKEHWSKLK
ncbi:MAG: hypothetical protein U9Q69_06000, partial [Nanoarchaeota archaeon]|nr:hypothetical protein [Nanoarchaeota archaeon]